MFIRVATVDDSLHILKSSDRKTKTYTTVDVETFKPGDLVYLRKSTIDEQYWDTHFFGYETSWVKPEQVFMYAGLSEQGGMQRGVLRINFLIEEKLVTTEISLSHECFVTSKLTRLI